MKTWRRVLYCEPSPFGDVFTLLERAQGSQAIRRSAVMRLTEADTRRALAAMGETGDEIDAMIAQARSRELDVPALTGGSRLRSDEPH